MKISMLNVYDNRPFMFSMYVLNESLSICVDLNKVVYTLTANKPCYSDNKLSKRIMANQEKKSTTFFIQ